MVIVAGHIDVEPQQRESYLVERWESQAAVKAFRRSAPRNNSIHGTAVFPGQAGGRGRNRTCDRSGVSRVLSR